MFEKRLNRFIAFYEQIINLSIISSTKFLDIINLSIIIILRKMLHLLPDQFEIVVNRLNSLKALSTCKDLNTPQ